MSLADLPAIDDPLIPEHFPGRRNVVEPICDRLRQAELLSSQVVGGPRSGKTSLLRYLASECAEAALGRATHLIRVYVDAVPLGPHSAPTQFWRLAFRELRTSTAGGTMLRQNAELAAAFDRALDRSTDGTLDLFDLQDLFDEFGKARRPVVLLVDEFDTVIGNPHFLPPADFFNQVRNLCNRTPRGLAFVVTTGRPLSDVGATAAGPSPPYNHFLTFVLSPLDETELRTRLAWLAERAGVTVSEDAWRAIAQASCGQPMLAGCLARRLVEARAHGAGFGPTQMEEIIADPDGPFAQLHQAILAALNARERQALQAWLADPRSVTEAQGVLLRRLGKFALLPPGVAL